MPETDPVTPVAVPTDTNYSSWLWEHTLAATTGTAIPSRDTVTKPLWLNAADAYGPTKDFLVKSTVATENVSGGSGRANGLNFGGTSTRYICGAANFTWDEFNKESGPLAKFNMDAWRTLSLVANGQYRGSGITADPKTFFNSSVAVGNVATWLGERSPELLKLRDDLGTDNSGLKGTAAGAVRNLVHNLGTSMENISAQMTSTPLGKYSDSVWDSGSALTTCFSGLMRAYSAWASDPACMPASAVQTTLSKAAQGMEGQWTFLFEDARNTPLGDLTTAAGWTAVETQAKAEWTNGVTRTLDAISQPEIVKLTTQYAKTQNTLRDVTKPPLTTAEKADPKDADGDGIPDAQDPTPNGPDADGDGIPDATDEFPNDPTNNNAAPDAPAGPDATDLPTDPTNNNDPFNNSLLNDPNAPDAPNGPDADGDGIPDLQDPTPNGPDADGDGIPDLQDPTPNSPNSPDSPDGDLDNFRPPVPPGLNAPPPPPVSNITTPNFPSSNGPFPGVVVPAGGFAPASMVRPPGIKGGLGGPNSGGLFGGRGAGGGGLGGGAARGGGPLGGGMPMYPPMGGQGGGQGQQERDRTTWLTEEDETWGLNQELPPSVIGRDDQYA